MAFTKPAQVPTTIGNIRIILTDLPADERQGARKEITYQLEVLDVDGEQMEHRGFKGDLRPHISAQAQAQMEAFMDTMRAKAVAEILGA